MEVVVMLSYYKGKVGIFNLKESSPRRKSGYVFDSSSLHSIF